MKNFKLITYAIISLAILTLIGYWAMATIESGSLHVDKQKQKELTDQNQELEKEVEKLKNELRMIQAEQEKTNETLSTEPVPEQTTPAGTTSAKYQSLINDLQKLVADNIYMKEKSKGTRVGTIQTFLNIYNNTSKKVDNDYGKGTKADIAAFQKAVGLTADGESGVNTFKKMIEWLEKNS